MRFGVRHGLLLVAVGGLMALGVHGNIWAVYHLIRAALIWHR